MKLRTLKDIDVEGKRALVRVDFNVPLQEGRVANDKRIKSALRTINYLLDKDAVVILVSHLGRPGGRAEESLRMDPVARRLESLLEKPVRKLDDCIGERVENELKELKGGQVALLENSRFHPGEKENDQQFAKALSRLADIFVNDAFGTAHRLHASTYGVAQILPSVAGFLMEKEVEMLNRAVDNPKKPMVGIIGGAKVKSKIGALTDLLGRVDTFLIGGGISYTFLKAQGYSVGDSILDQQMVKEAKKFSQQAKKEGVEVILPQDVKVASSNMADIATVDVNEIGDGWAGYDIGPATIREFRRKLRPASTVIWAGPLGMYENSEFAEGTRGIAQFLADLDAFRVIGGGDTAAAIEQFNLAGKMDHVSTGGGACLAYLRGKRMPVLESLEG